MELIFKAALYVLIAANVAFPIARWATSSAPESSAAQMHPELLSILDPAKIEAARAKLAKVDSALCVKLSGLGPEELASAMSALGARSGAKEFKSEVGAAWWIQWGGAATEREANSKADELGRIAGYRFVHWTGAKGWGARTGPFSTQIEASSALRGLEGRGLTVGKDAAEAGREVRFGPWPRVALSDLDSAARGWGGAKVAECSQKEQEEWEKAK